MAANYASCIIVIIKDIFLINNFQSIIKGYQYNYMPDNLPHTLANISFYRWGSSTTNQLAGRKIGLGSNKFVKFANNLKAFFCIGARAIIPPPIYTKGLPRAL